MAGSAFARPVSDLLLPESEELDDFAVEDAPSEDEDDDEDEVLPSDDEVDFVEVVRLSVL